MSITVSFESEATGAVLEVGYVKRDCPDLAGVNISILPETDMGGLRIYLTIEQVRKLSDLLGAIGEAEAAS